MKTILLIPFVFLSSCAGFPLTLAYINEDVAGHELAASVTVGGKVPVGTLAMSKKYKPIGVDRGK